LWYAPFAFLALGLFFFIRSLLNKKKTEKIQTVDTTNTKVK